MPRIYAKQLGCRNYCNYTPAVLEQCLEAIRSGQMSQRQTEAKYNIPRSTIKNKLCNKFKGKPGHPTVFELEDEAVFAHHLIKLAEFGFPLVESELRNVIKQYINKKGIKIKQFRDNLPGYDWVKGFIMRQPQLTSRMCSNIKRERAAIDDKIILDYFDKLKTSIEGVLPQNIWNYDETNLCDDPGVAKVICRRGSKYVECIQDHTKTSTSIMLCGNAVGDIMPIYVVYKSEHLWTTWTEGGPANCRYNRSKSGWIEMSTFEDWFISLVLPKLKHQDGVKVLVGDNLSSHINMNVLKLCEDNNIRFVCLPPRSTHLTQPLDVAYFRPMKIAWRKILHNWKQSSEGLKYSNLLKDVFPHLLKQLSNELLTNKGDNLISGFKKCGIYPLDVSEVLSRLPKKSADINEVGEAFMQFLTKKRDECSGNKKTRQRRKLQVPAGKSISPGDLNPIGLHDIRTTSSITKNNISKKKPIELSDSETSNEDISLHDSSSDMDIEELAAECSTSTGIEETDNTDINQDGNWKANLIQGDFVTVLYDKEEFPGRIVKLPEVGDEGPTVECMEKSRKSWKWPEKEDQLIYKWSAVQIKNKSPTNE